MSLTTLALGRFTGDGNGIERGPLIDTIVALSS
jgi:hypothetical protein